MLFEREGSIDYPQYRLRQQVKVQPPTKLLSHKNILISSLLMFGICLGTTNPAFALGCTCKDVKITLKNASDDTIKVTKFEYKDVDKNKFREIR
jgi:hypothetical protein